MNMEITRSELAQMAMAFEVAAWNKPGNVDRCHDYPDTRFEHFLASVIFCREALIKAEKGEGSIGGLIREATILTSRHKGGNTHFGAFILLIPLIMGGGIPGASRLVRESTLDDALAFYDAFSYTNVRVRESDELDINDPAAKERLKEQGMTLFQVMEHSAPYDMVAEEFIAGFPLTRYTADLLRKYESSHHPISTVFLKLLSEYPDTFIAKKFGINAALEVQQKASSVVEGTISIEDLDDFCLEKGYNPGSLADIMIAGIYIALGEGWKWE